MDGLSINLAPKLDQQQVLSHEMQQGLQILQRPILELRAELQKIMELNPAIEDVTWDKERMLSEALPEEHVSGSVSEQELDFDRDQGMGALNTDDAERDVYLNNLENFEPSYENGSVDPDAESKRQLFFDRQVQNETLQEHLARQVSTSNIPDEDRAIAIDMLIGNIDDDGWLHRSLADIEMVTGKDEKHLLRLLKIISTFDPVGCGGRDLRETLLYQMEKLDDSPWEDEVRKFIDLHLNDFERRRTDVILKSLKIGPEDLPKVLAEVHKLSPKPGLGFSTSESPGIIVTPEVYVRRSQSGHWIAVVPERNLPDIKISKKYLKWLEDPNLPADAKAFVREKVKAAIEIRDAIAERQETIRKIAQSIIDFQHEVFDKKSMSALKPLTMDKVAKETDVHNSTVSRTVCGKYMRTPWGCVEMRKFFVAGLSTENGEAGISNVAVMARIRQLVEEEDKSKPLSDQKIADMLKAEGITVARRTVAKYREQLHIPGTSERKQV